MNHGFIGKMEIMVKFKVISNLLSEDKYIVSSNLPELSIEEIQLAAPDGQTCWLGAGYSRWNLLEIITDISDMTILYKQLFDLESDTIFVKNCYILSDKKSIYYKEVLSKDIN